MCTLAGAISREPALAKEDLLAGDGMINWIALHDSNVDREVRRQRDAHRDDSYALLFTTMMCCDLTRPFSFFDGSRASTIHEWAEAAVQLAGGISTSSGKKTAFVDYTRGLMLRLKGVDGRLLR